MKTLPGTIPGLLRRGSPVVLNREVAGFPATKRVTRRGIFMPHGPKGDEGMVCWDRWCGEKRAEERVFIPTISLDLTDPTGRAHAAWWARSKRGARTTHATTCAIDFALRGAGMAEDEIARLRFYVLDSALMRYPHHPSAPEWRALLDAGQNRTGHGDR